MSWVGRGTVGGAVMLCWCERDWGGAVLCW